MSFITLKIPPAIAFTGDDFEQLAEINRKVRLELTSQGELVIMPPTGGETGNRNLDIEGQLWFWNRQTGLGKAFNSSTGFRLPNGAVRSPDASWVEISRWERLDAEVRKKFLPLCPDFAVELVSESDEVKETRQKMQEYVDNGLRLGWLINPQDCTVEIYRGNAEVEILENPESVAGEDVLEGFTLDLGRIWE